MTETILALPTHLRKRLAQALESGILATPCSEAALRSVLGLREGGGEVVAALGELERLGVTGPAAACKSVRTPPARSCVCEHRPPTMGGGKPSKQCRNATCSVA